MHGMEKFNLQARLGIILALFLLLAMLAALVRAIVAADANIMEEVESVTTLVNRMFSIVELGNESPLSPDTDPAFLQELIALDNLRHIDVRIRSELVDYPQVNESSLSAIDAPGWFVSLVHPDSDMEIRTFIQSNGDFVSLFADPADEIEEIWEETRSRFLATMTFLLLILGALYFLVRHWMKPLENISGVLDNVELGVTSTADLIKIALSNGIIKM